MLMLTLQAISMKKLSKNSILNKQLVKTIKSQKLCSLRMTYKRSFKASTGTQEVSSFLKN